MKVAAKQSPVKDGRSKLFGLGASAKKFRYGGIV